MKCRLVQISRRFPRRRISTEAAVSAIGLVEQACIRFAAAYEVVATMSGSTNSTRSSFARSAIPASEIPVMLNPLISKLHQTLPALPPKRAAYADANATQFA